MPPRKEDQIQIPEAVFNRANAAAMRGQAIADTGSIFTERERSMPRQVGGIGYPSGPFQQGGLPSFPFGGRGSTSLDTVDRGFNWSAQQVPAGGFTRTNPNISFESVQNQKNVQYTQDAASRIANRYMIPTVGIAQQNISFGNPFGNRFSATDYVNPERARSVEISNANIAARSPIASSPDVGAAGFSRNIQTGAGGKTEQIVSPYGFASTNLTPQQMEQRALARSEAERTGTMPRTPEQQQALLAQMRQAGAGIRERIAATGAKEAKENLGKYYAFRQSIAEREAQRALTPSFGTTVSREAEMRGVQAMIEAERMRQAQQGRNPMSQEPISAFGYQFQRGSMGQYNPVRSMTTRSGFVPSGGPQPTASFGTMQSSFGMPSATGSIASGFLPSFSLGGGEQKDEYLRRNFPQDYFTGAFGSQGRNMMYRPNPFDQTRTL